MELAQFDLTVPAENNNKKKKKKRSQQIMRT